MAPLRLLRSHRQTLLASTFAVAAVVFMALGVWVGTRGRPGIADGAGPAPVDAAPITFVSAPADALAPVPAVATLSGRPGVTPGSPAPKAPTNRPEQTGPVPPPGSPAPVPAPTQPSPTVGAAPVPQPAPPAQPTPPPQVLEQLIDLAGGLLAPVLGR